MSLKDLFYLTNLRSDTEVFLSANRKNRGEPCFLYRFVSKRVPLGRLELPTHSLGNCCSIH